MNQLKQLAVMVDRTELLKNSSEKLRRLTKARSKNAPSPIVIKIGEDNGNSYRNVRKLLTYTQLCKLAEIYNVRIKDLVHRFSSVLISCNVSVKNRIKKVYKKYRNNSNYKYQRPINKTVKFGSFVFLM